MNGALAVWAALQAGVFVAAAPLLLGVVKRLKCLLQNRNSPPLTQPYRDLARLFRKQPVLAENASWLFRITPYVVFGATITATALVPLLSLTTPGAQLGDIIVLVGLLALARVFTALAAMDIGTAFGGMGASREMTVSALTEPAMLMAIFTLTMTAAGTNLATAMGNILEQGLILRPSFTFALLGLMLVAVAETGRIPVDNPATHLELTMLHEAMVLEYSGRHLALLEWAAQIKFMIFAVLIVDLFLPWGIALDLNAAALAVAAGALLLKLIILAALLVTAESILAKLRLFRVPEYLNLAFLLSLLGLLSHVILEVA
jgi:formate hydrogenlyase subunit 4